MKANGHVFKYGDNVDTDVIIPARYLNSPDGNELAKHCMEDIDVDFVKNVKEGDIIKIDIPAMTLDVDVSDEEMEQRRKEWVPREPKVTTGYLSRYRELVTSGNRGAILEVPKNK